VLVYVLITAFFGAVHDAIYSCGTSRYGSWSWRLGLVSGSFLIAFWNFWEAHFFLLDNGGTTISISIGISSTISIIIIIIPLRVSNFLLGLSRAQRVDDFVDAELSSHYGTGGWFHSTLFEFQESPTPFDSEKVDNSLCHSFVFQGILFVSLNITEHLLLN
jgi:hypothetical protein